MDFFSVDRAGDALDAGEDAMAGGCDSEYRRQSVRRSAWGSGSVLSPDGEGKNSWDYGRIEQGFSGRENHETRKKSFS